MGVVKSGESIKVYKKGTFTTCDNALLPYSDAPLTIFIRTFLKALTNVEIGRCFITTINFQLVA